jgi:hypothetical protein
VYAYRYGHHFWNGRCEKCHAHEWSLAAIRQCDPPKPTGELLEQLARAEVKP